jgi:hypothetical protein
VSARDSPDMSFERGPRPIERSEGWFTEGQAARVPYHGAANLAPGNCIVEIGSHHGYATILFALAAVRARHRAIDPSARAQPL